MFVTLSETMQGKAHYNRHSSDSVTTTTAVKKGSSQDHFLCCHGGKNILKK